MTIQMPPALPPTSQKPVLIRPDFVAPSECAVMLDAFRAAARASDELLDMPFRTEMALGLAIEHISPALRGQVSDIRERARAAIAAFYAAREELFVEYTLFSEMRVGDAHVLHADAERQDESGQWVPNHTPWRHSVALLYLNTWGTEFDGGVLLLPDVGRRVRPRAGELVAFPATHEYRHEVTPVTRGSRCVLAIWVTQDVHYREIGWPR